ncbi:MAG: GyrI-like domain-containing protein [Methanobrevibacter sp.]|nr:GyrI-like domain-containing protein [Methanobrevibacter sp.]
MRREVKIQDVTIGSVANIKHKGSFKELKLTFERLEKWIKKHNLKSKGTYHCRFDSKYEDLSSNEIFFELAMPVKKLAKYKHFANIVQIPERDVISALYKGSYFNLPSVHRILADYARKNFLAPMDSPTEIYLNDPFEVKPSELLTEVQFTVLDFKSENLSYVPLVSEIERKLIKKQKMAFMEHYGLIEDVYKVRVDLIKWAEKHDIKVEGLHFKHYPSPEGIPPRGMAFKVGIPISTDIKEEEGIKIVEVPEHEVLTAIYKGPYINIPNITRMMVDYSFENDLEVLGFAEEIYLNSIFDVGCDELLTEVRMDVIDFNFDMNIKLEKEIERKTIKRHEIASVRQVGSFEKINKIKADLFNWVETNNIKTSGHHFLRFHNNPHSLSPETISYEIGIPLDSAAEDIIKVIDYTRHKILTTTHNGPISTLKDTHDFLKNYSIENGFTHLDLLVNTFLDKIPESHEDEVLILVGLPVKKV